MGAVMDGSIDGRVVENVPCGTASACPCAPPEGLSIVGVTLGVTSDAEASVAACAATDDGVIRPRP